MILVISVRCRTPGCNAEGRFPFRWCEIGGQKVIRDRWPQLSTVLQHFHNEGWGDFCVGVNPVCPRCMLAAGAETEEVGPVEPGAWEDGRGR